MIAEQPLKGLLVTTKDGDWGIESPQEGFVPYRVIRGADFPEVREGDITTTPLRFLKEDTVDRRTLQHKDILIETAGGNRDRPTGRTLFITEKLLHRYDYPVTCASFARFLRIDSSKAEPEYVFWYLQFLYETGVMWEHQVQHTGVARFQYTRFAESVKIPLPSTSEQRATAGILGALDDKIELNRRMNRTLESMARAVFREMMKDEGGRMKVKKLGDICEFAYGKGLKEDERQTGSIPVYGSNGQIGWHNEYLVKGPGIVVGRKGNPGIITWSQNNFFPIDTTFYVVPKEPKTSLHWLYYALISLNLPDLGADSAVPGLNRNIAYMSDVDYPSEELMKRFDAFVIPVFDKIDANEKESRTLASLRDSLLPKLMRGEVRVRA